MRDVTIILNREEIMNDVMSVAHVTGRRLSVAGQEEKASDIQTPEEGADKYIVARAMSAALANVRERCARYLTAGRLMDDDRLEDSDLADRVTQFNKVTLIEHEARLTRVRNDPVQPQFGEGRTGPGDQSFGGG